MGQTLFCYPILEITVHTDSYDLGYQGLDISAMGANHVGGITHRIGPTRFSCSRSQAAGPTSFWAQHRCMAWNL